MVTDILQNIGLHTPGRPLDLAGLLDAFSQWAEVQEICPEDTAFMTALIGAFICEFLVDHHAAIRVVHGGRIVLQLPIQNGISREFDPYAVAAGLVQNHGSVALFLRKLTAD